MSDTKEAFHSQLLEAWQRRSQLLEETIPLLYVEGLSTRAAFNNWRHRDRSLEAIIYLFLDGIYLGVRGNSRDKEAVLVAHAITRDGKRVESCT